MTWLSLLDFLGGAALFESSMLFSAADPPPEIHRQLSRWTAAGRLVQLRRGLYVVAPPYRREPPSPWEVAARLRRPSYVSLESALSYHGLIPEGVAAVTSVTTGRPGLIETPLGSFVYRHVKRSLFWGFSAMEPSGVPEAYMASAEKALLDLFHLARGPVSESYIAELRLEASAEIDLRRLRRLAARTGEEKIIAAAEWTAGTLASERAESVKL